MPYVQGGAIIEEHLGQPAAGGASGASYGPGKARFTGASSASYLTTLTKLTSKVHGKFTSNRDSQRARCWLGE